MKVYSKLIIIFFSILMSEWIGNIQYIIDHLNIRFCFEMVFPLFDYILSMLMIWHFWVNAYVWDVNGR